MISAGKEFAQPVNKGLQRQSRTMLSRVLLNVLLLSSLMDKVVRVVQQIVFNVHLCQLVQNVQVRMHYLTMSVFSNARQRILMRLLMARVCVFNVIHLA